MEGGTAEGISMSALSIHEVAQELNVKKRQVYRLIRQRRILAFRVGKLIRVTREDLLTFIEEQRAREVR